jgi:hypothetical protein
MEDNEKKIFPKSDKWFSLVVALWALAVVFCYSLQYFEPAQMDYIKENLSKIYKMVVR